MKRIGNYIIIESHEDFLEHWNDYSRRFDGQVMHDLPTTYPAFYEYIPNTLEPYYCGDWEVRTKEQFIENLEETIRNKEQALNNLKTFANTLKNT